jgi:predicted NAD/FAD-dependent oxidoreductase
MKFESTYFGVILINLAIIGAGVGGCSAAYFASKYLPDSKITIYEASDRVGGRVLTFEEGPLKLEIGAEFFNPTNKTILGLVKDMKLRVRKLEESMNFAIWTGSKIIFKSNQVATLTMLKLLMRYKLNVSKMFFILKEATRLVKHLYEENWENPSAVDELFESVGLDKWYRKQFNSILNERGMDETFIDDVVTPITRTIYSQNADLGGFAGLTSMIGVYVGPLYSLADGNSVLPRSLAEASNSEVRLRQKVKNIEKTPDGSYRVSVGEKTSIFDGVVIAVPLELAGLEFDGVSMRKWKPQQYKSVYTKVMRGFVDPRYFGLEETRRLPPMILTTAEANQITHFAIERSANGESLLIISSTEPLSNDALCGVFKDGKMVLEHSWEAAYPAFKPIDRLPPSRLDEKLMYLNSIESAASSMEASAFSALNAIKMMKREFR